jgi:RNA polymerase sigma-70 factor (ECF subfamily)
MTTSSPDAVEGLDGAMSVFTRVRGRLFGIAYRVLGSAHDAEDIVQEAWVRWQTYDRSDVREPEAFLAVTTTRLALNLAQSARARYENYVGPWVPSPVDTSSDPTLGAERNEALELAVMLLLQKLSPTERAAYVLREAFDYPYATIADMLQTSQAAVRQLVSRARKRLDGEKRTTVSPEAHRELLSAFVNAASTGDIDELERLLTAEVVSITDGNGAAHTARRAVVGRDHVARFVHGFSERFWFDVSVRFVEANGQQGALFFEGSAPIALLSITADEEGISQLLWHMNPDKLDRIVAAAG